MVVDSNNVVYTTPNFCINDPYFEKEILPDQEDDKLNNEMIEIYLYDLYQNKKYSINLSPNTLGSEIKKKFCDLTDINISNVKIRLLFGGAEIRDEHHLRQHKISGGFTIQIMINKI